MSWLTRIITYHPKVILIALTVFSTTCLILPLAIVKIPNFKDPQLGFETRGTEIAKRLRAWENLQDNIRPSGPLTVKPDLSSYYKQDKKNGGKSTDVKDKNKTKSGNELMSAGKTSIFPSSGSAEDHDSSKNFLNVSIILDSEVGRNTTEDEELKELKDILDDVRHLSPFNHTGHEHEHLSSDKFFCMGPIEEYSRVVVSSMDGRDLFTRSSLIAMCSMEAKLVSPVEFGAVCETIVRGRCCRQWSLPNYVAMLNHRPSCFNITDSDVIKTKNLLSKCRKFYMPDLTNKEVPTECTEHDAVFNIINFLLDYEYTNESHPLKNVLVFLPIARSSAIKNYYHSLTKYHFRSEGIEITGIDFGLKNTLFDDYLVDDIRLVGVGACFVFLIMWTYTGSFFITFMNLLAVFFSLVISYFVYTLVMELTFFPFMNILATVVAVGIGGDASLIVYKLWSCSSDEETSKLKLMESVHGHSLKCMTVSSLTTAIAFYSSYVSKITAICCFSMFAGTAILANLLVMAAWTPATLVVAESVTSTVTLLPPLVKSSLERISQTCRTLLVDAVLKLKYFWIVLFGSVALLSFPILFGYPRLRLPDTPDLQLFSSNHPFERYDLVYKDRFRFERVLKINSELTGRGRLPMRFVWGVKPVDTGNYMNPSSRGKLVLDPTFDLASKDSQTWLLSFCTKLRSQPFYNPTFGPLLPNCFLQSFVDWMERKCVDPVRGQSREPCCESATFPYERNVFSLCIAQASLSLYQTPVELIMSGGAGPKYAVKSKSRIPKVKAIVVEYESNYTISSSYVEMNKFYTEIEAWTQEELSRAPAGMRNGWFVSYLHLYDLQASLARDTLVAILVATLVSFIVVVFYTADVVLSLLAVLTISFVISVTLAVLVLFGWKLNLVEAVAVSLVIGLGVDFSAHYVVSYRFAPENSTRESATIYTLSMMGGPILMGALTTIAAGAFMIPSSVLAYNQIGIFLVTVTVVSWTYATLFLMSLLCVMGPVGGHPGRVGGRHLPESARGSVGSREQHELVGNLRRGSKRRAAENSPSAASATTIVQEESEISILQPSTLT